MNQSHLPHAIIMKQSGREITYHDVGVINNTIERFPSLSRSALIGTICECLEWFNAAGNPKATACRKVLESLEQQGIIRLPAKDNRWVGKQRPKTIVFTERTQEQSLLKGSLSSFSPIEVIPIAHQDQSLWNEYMARYHPLGYKRPFGHRLCYFIYSGNQIFGCILLSGAAKALASRDRWIGWEKATRLQHLPWVINQSRYLIFPWVQVKNLASHALGQLAARASGDFDAEWGFRPLLMETFVDPKYYSGTCYRAAGWSHLGETTGAGLARPGKEYTSSPKLIFVKPLHPECRELLCTGQLATGNTE